MATTLTSQLNVRMDAQLRDAGDAVLERVGVMPAELVRALWAKIASGAQECEQVLALLAAQAPSETASRGEACLAQIDGWQEQLYALAEVDRMAYVAPSDDELDEMFYDEWLSRDEGRVVS
jgi:hypothetical protein